MLENQNISHYELGEKLGEGGMGVVYKAWDRKLNRFVALKFLSGNWANSAEQVTRFQHEALAISALNHANIATIYEIDEYDGHFFLALEYLPGGTLKTALDQLAGAGQQLSVEQGLEYALQLTEAVAHAHSRGVIHRDIKSANALFTESGAVKLTDFGLAKLARGTGVTQSGSVMGTPASMAPEQAQGLETDERSDVFSLGLIMFELFAGELPFRGENSLAVLHQIVNVTAPPLSQRRSGIPVALERIVAKALERDRADRYQSAGELAADLRTLRRELLFGSSAQRSSLETVAIGTAPVRRRRGPPLKRTLGVVAACVVLGTAVWFAWPSVRARAVAWFSARSLPDERRLLILPFRSVGGTEKDQTYADGLREVLISELTRTERPGGPLVVVVSPGEVQDKEISNSAEAWRRLGANLVMTGTVLQSSGKPELIVNLEDGQNPAVLGSTRMDVSNPDLTAGAVALIRMLELSLSAKTRGDLEAGASADPAATRDYVEGLGYLARSDRADKIDLAVIAFREAVRKDPNYALASAGLAQALWQKFNLQRERALLDEAAGYAGRALQLNPKVAAVHITMSQIERTRGDNEAAVKQLEEALAIEPANATALRSLATVYAAMERYQDAEKTYQRAIDARPGDVTGFISQGKFFFDRERRPEAERSFLGAVERAPDSYLAHSNLAAVYLQMDRKEEAISQLEKSAEIAPSGAAWSNLGVAHYRMKHYEEAAAAYLKAVDKAPLRSDYWGNLAEAYLLARDLRDKAPEAYKTAIRLLKEDIRATPTNPRLHARLAMYYAFLPDRDRALSEIAEAVRLDPSKSAYVQFKATVVYERLGDRPGALRALKAALDAHQSMAEVEGSPFLASLRTEPAYLRMASPRF